MIIIRNSCLQHQLNRIAMEHASRSRCDVNTHFGMSKILHLSSYHDRLIGSTLVVAFERPPVWHMTCGADPELLRAHEVAVDLCLPSRWSQPARSADIDESLAVLNYKWTSEQVGHCCRLIRRGRTTRYCCSTMDDVVDAIKIAIVVLIMHQMPSVPCLSRWLTVFCSGGYYLLGSLLHNLLPRGYRRAFGEYKLEDSYASKEEKDDDWTFPTYLPTYLPTYPPTYLPTCLPTYLPTYLLTYLRKPHKPQESQAWKAPSPWLCIF